MAGKLQRRFAAALAAVTLTLLLPAQAWAAEPGAPQLVIEAARRSRGGFGFGLLALLCCLGVVAAIVVAFVLFSRKRKRR